MAVYLEPTEGSGSLHILAACGVKIEGKEVTVSGDSGVLLYEGKAEESEEGEVSVEARGKVELSVDEGENTVHNRGKETAY